MKRSRFTLVWLILVVVVAAASAGQTIPYDIDFTRFEGPLTSDGSYPLSFSLWTDEVGGELVWQEELDQVAVQDGFSFVDLGTKTPLPDDADERWLETRVAGQTLWPRTRLHLFGTVSIQGSLGVNNGLQISNTPDHNSSISLGAGGGLGIRNFAGGDISLSTGTAVSSTSSRLHIDPNGLVRLNGGGDAKLTEGSGYLMIGSHSGTNLLMDTNELMARNNGQPATLFLQQNGGAVFVNGAEAHMSDARRKREVRDLESGLAEVLSLRPVSFAWKGGGDRRHLGLIAQEVRRLSEDLIYEDEEGFMGVSYTELVPLLIRALQEQQQRIDELEADFEELRSLGSPVGD